MKRRHQEHAAFRPLVMKDLYDVRKATYDVDYADYRREQHEPTGYGKPRKRSAEGKRAGIAHEHAGGKRVIHQKAAKCSG